MKSKKIVGIIQVRMGSTRLPGKSLALIEGRPFLSLILERLRGSKTMSQLVVATTTASADDAIADLANEENITVYRGSENDVLDRFYNAALVSNAQVIVRITADDPFKDPEIIDQIVTELQQENLDYASNTMEPTYPEGLDIEVFTFEALAKAWTEARLPSEREHVTPYIWKRPDLFRVKSIRQNQDLSKLRWTLDYPEDLLFAREIYKRLYKGQIFYMRDILELLEREPALAEINAGIARNAGYLASLKKDSELTN